jgi:hypothetical protein
MGMGGAMGGGGGGFGKRGSSPLRRMLRRLASGHGSAAVGMYLVRSNE